jgi:O-antigen ligase
VLSLVASKGVVVLLFAALLALAIARYLESGRLPKPPRKIALLLAALILWALVASIWSFEPAEAAGRALRAAAVMLCGLLLAQILWETSAEAAERALSWLLAGVLLGLAVVSVELVFGHPLFSGLKGSLDSRYLEMSRLNRGASALAILSWLAAAGLALKGRLAAAALTVLAVGGLLVFLESSAALLGLVIGALALLLGLCHRLATRIFLVLGVIGLLFASPGLAKLLDRAGVSETRGLQTTARERVYMWNFTADRILEKPIIGWGFDAARNMPNFGVAPFDPRRGKKKKNAVPGDGKRKKVMAHHPHNAGLQILLELGLVGAVLSAFLLWALLRPLERLPRGPRLWATASVMTTLGIAATAYGIWQNQWLALIAATAAVIALLGAATRKGEAC